MTTYRLDHLFAPRSVAVVGASPRATSVGRKILANLKAAKFDGPIRLVNPAYPEIEGISAAKDVATLLPTDLLVITSPPHSVPGTIAAAAARDFPAAIIVT